MRYIAVMNCPECPYCGKDHDFPDNDGWCKHPDFDSSVEAGGSSIGNLNELRKNDIIHEKCPLKNYITVISKIRELMIQEAKIEAELKIKRIRNS